MSLGQAHLRTKIETNNISSFLVAENSPKSPSLSLWVSVCDSPILSSHLVSILFEKEGKKTKGSTGENRC
jgi:hypothetical protein